MKFNVRFIILYKKENIIAGYPPVRFARSWENQLLHKSKCYALVFCFFLAVDTTKVPEQPMQTYQNWYSSGEEQSFLLFN